MSTDSRDPGLRVLWHGVWLTVVADADDYLTGLTLYFVGYVLFEVRRRV